LELGDLLQALRRFWALGVAVLALCIGAGAVAAFVPTPTYKATSTLLVEPRGPSIDFSSVEAVTFLLPSIVEQVGAPGFEQRVIAAADPTVSPSSVSITGESKSGTSIFKVHAESPNKYVATRLANGAARQLVQGKISDRLKLSLLAPATVPSSPASPMRVAIMAGATGLGLIAALFSVLAANAARRRLQSAEEIQRRFGLEVLGEIPASRRFPRTAAEVFLKEDHAELAEAFQRLRTNLELATEGDGTIAVISCAPGEGKSTVTANLAWALASLGRRVVAVDCDLRKPSLYRLLELASRPGMAEVAAGADPKELAQRTQEPTLRGIPAGDVDRHPAQILHDGIPRLFDGLHDSTVLIDTPPLLGVAEGAFVATSAAAVLVVIDARHRNPDELERVLHELERGNAHVIGAVLNRARVSRPSYTSTYYRTTHAASGAGLSTEDHSLQSRRARRMLSR
jgi:capsular exopolysaccharide synthesis family protein